MKLSALKNKLQYKVVPAMATPLDSSSYRLNADGVGPLVEFLIARGVGGIFPGGSTGEGLLLSLEDRKSLHEVTMRAVAGRLPVLMHVGANTTQQAVELTEHAVGLGADAIVAIPPVFFGALDSHLLGYFKAIAAAAPDTPLFAYDIPHLAINGISVALVKMLSAEIPTFLGVKCSHPDAQHVRKRIEAQPDRILLAGNEGIMLGSMALGAHGAISGLSTAVPEPFVAMLNAYAKGDMQTAQQMQRLINRINDLCPAGERIGGIKAILVARGVDVGAPVLPRTAVTSNFHEAILAELSDAGL